jgi:hypothetical protein
MLTPKFEVDEHVYVNVETYKRTHVPCSFCNCGEIKGLDGTTEKCPRCRGKGTNFEEGASFIKVKGVIDYLTIGRREIWYGVEYDEEIDDNYLVEMGSNKGINCTEKFLSKIID